MRGYLRGKAQRIFNILSSGLSRGEWAKLLSFRFALQRASPLDAAVGFGHTGVTRELIEHGTDANAIGSEGRAALYWSVYANKAKTIDLLVGAGRSRRGSSDVDGESRRLGTSPSLALRRLKKVRCCRHPPEERRRCQRPRPGGENSFAPGRQCRPDSQAWVEW